VTKFPNEGDGADEAPSRDRVINISMGEEEILPPIKYPGFAELAVSEQVEILAHEVVHNKEEFPIEILLRNLGIDLKRYSEIINDDDYSRLVSQKSINQILMPKFPSIIEALGEGAKSGNDTKVKMALQLTKSLGPEVAIQNNLYTEMSDKELKKEAQRISKMLEDENESE